MTLAVVLASLATSARAALVAYYDFAPSTVTTSAGTETIANLGTAGSALNGYWFTGGDAPTVTAGAIGSSGGTTGILSFSPTSNSDGTSYMEIDGLNSYMPALDYTGASAWSFAEWIQTTSGETGGTFFSQGNTAPSGSWSNTTDNSYYYLHNNSNGAGQYVGGVRNSGGNWYSSATVNNAVWHMITIEYNGAGGSNGVDPIVYVDGGGNIFENDNINLSKPGVGTVVRVGWSGPGENSSINFSGSMANVAFWNQALTQDEAASLFNLSSSTIAAVNQYTDVQMSQLFSIAEGSSASATITSNGNTINWAPATSGTAALVATGGTFGQIWSSGGNYYVWTESSTSAGTYYAVVGTLGTSSGSVAGSNFVWAGTADNTWENSANWYLSSGTSASSIPDGVGLTATFGSPASNSQAVLGASHTVSGLTFLGTVGTTISATGAATLNLTGSNSAIVPIAVAGTNTISAPVALNSPAAIFVANGGQLTLSGPISGTGSLSTAGSGGGAGMLVLSGSNSYTGGTTVSGGTLQLGNASALGAISNALSVAGGTLDLSGQAVSAGTVTLASGSIVDSVGSGSLTSGYFDVKTGSISAALGGVGALTMNGGGLVNLSGSNSYTGGVTVSSGTLQLGSASALGVSSNSVVVGGGTLDVAGQAATVGAVSLSGGAIIDSVGTGSLAAASFNVQSGSISANLAGATAGLDQVSATGLTVLSGSNSYGGGTTVSAGSLQAVYTYSLPGYTTSGNVSVAGGAALILNVGGAGQFQAADVTSVLANVAFNGSSYLGFDTTNALGGTYTVADNITLPNLGLIKAGANTLVLAGTNTYGGSTTISGGALQLGSGLAVQNSTVNVGVNNGLAFSSGITQFTLGGLAGGGSVTLQDTAFQPVALNIGGNGAATTYSGSLMGSGSIDVTGPGILTLTGSSNFAGGATVNGGTLAVTNNAGLGTGTVTINANGALNLNGLGTINNAFAGSGTINVNPNGAETTFTYPFNSSTTFDGVLNVNAGGGKADFRGGSIAGGTINIAGGATLYLVSSASFTPVIGATIYVAGVGNGENLGALRVEYGSNVTGNVVLTGNATIGNGSGTSNPAGIISGSIGQQGGPYGVTLVGNGLEVFAGSNTYAGTTTISGGTLELNNANALAQTTVTVNVNNGLQFFGNIGTFNIGGLSGGSGFALIDYSGAGVMLAVGGNGQSTVYSGSLSGPGSLNMAGTGMLNLSGNNTYGGGTFVNAGVLQLGSPTGLPNLGNLAANGGTLDLAGYSVTVGSFSGAAGTITNSDGVLSTLIVDQATATTFSGSITNGASQVALELTAGSLTLAGINTYSGGTSVESGTLILAAPTALADGSSLTVGEGASAIFSPVAAAPAVAAVPEPGALVLLAVGLWSAAACRRFSKRLSTVPIRKRKALSVSEAPPN
jgi:fibronectin-binding autotransporter adhesin